MLRARSMRRPIREMLQCRYCWTKRPVCVLKSHIRLPHLSVLSRGRQHKDIFLKGLCPQYLDGELEYFLAGTLGRFKRRVSSVIVVKRTNAWTNSVPIQYFNRSCGALRS